MTERQLASILYRDNIFMKHAERKRFQSELENLQPPVPKTMKVIEGGATASPISAALIIWIERDAPLDSNWMNWVAKLSLQFAMENAQVMDVLPVILCVLISHWDFLQLC